MEEDSAAACGREDICLAVGLSGRKPPNISAPGAAQALRRHYWPERRLDRDILSFQTPWSLTKMWVMSSRAVAPLSLPV